MSKNRVVYSYSSIYGRIAWAWPGVRTPKKTSFRIRFGIQLFRIFGFGFGFGYQIVRIFGFGFRIFRILPLKPKKSEIHTRITTRKTENSEAKLKYPKNLIFQPNPKNAVFFGFAPLSVSVFEFKTHHEYMVRVMVTTCHGHTMLFAHKWKNYCKDS